MRSLAWLLVFAAAVSAQPFDPGPRTAAVALIEQELTDAAIDVLKPAMAADPRWAFDRYDYGLALLMDRLNERALAELDAAEKLRPGLPRVAYLRAVALKRMHRLPEAIAAFESAAKDPALWTAVLNAALCALYQDDFAKATAGFERALALADQNARRWPISVGQARYIAHKNLSVLAGNTEGGEAEFQRHQDAAFKAWTGKVPQDDALELGPWVPPLAPTDPEPRAELAEAGVPPTPPCTAPPLELVAGKWTCLSDKSPASVRAVAWTTSGLAALVADGALWTRDGTSWKSTAPVTGEVIGGADLDEDGREELLARDERGRIELRPLPPARWAARRLEGLEDAGPVLAVDQDHDGDLDLVAAGRVGQVTGLWCYENRTKPGATDGPTLTRVPHQAVELTTPTSAPVVGLAAGDLDEGNDLDVVAFMRGASPVVFLSRRQGKFERVVTGGPAGTGPGVLADLDGDGHLDLAYPTARGVAVLIGRGDGGMLPARMLGGGDLVEVLAEDLDGDMRPDLVTRDRGGALGLWMSAADGEWRESRLPGDQRARTSPVLEDFDRDGAIDVGVPGGPVLWNRSGARAGFVRVTLDALSGSAPAHGVGSRVWVRAGTRAVRREMRHCGEVFALGGCDHADLVRMQWTNGIVQSQLEHEGALYDARVRSGSELAPVQRAGPKASCPYLYVDRGTGPEYVTDVLAGAPLGLPGADGHPVPCNPDELLLLPRGSWAPVDRSYRLRVTEEFREVTYLDRVRVWTADHAPGVAVLPDSGMGTPGGAPRVLTFDRVEAPVRAIGPDGEDATLLLAQADGHLVVPPLGAVQGLAPEHTIELTFPPVEAGRRASLVLEGLVFFSDAGINTRLAQADPGALRPPHLEVPVPDGGWRTVLPFVRFPAGRDKTAVTDVTGLFDPARPRFRLVGTMRLYLDRIALASRPAQDDPPVKLRRLAPASASVVFHGIAPLGPAPDRPPWFVVSGQRRRSSLEVSLIVPDGAYTAFGPALDLVRDLDDRFAVIGPGDGCDLTFPVPAGPAAGEVRDLLVELSGWDKDAHPATLGSKTVGPLPYRVSPDGMTHDARLTRVRAGLGGAR